LTPTLAPTPLSFTFGDGGLPVDRYATVVGAAAVLVYLFGDPARADPGTVSPSLDDDFQRLVGIWRTKTKDLDFMINIERGAVQITISGRRGEQGFSGAGVGHLSEVKQDGRGRYFELEPSTAQGTGLPQRIYYRLDGNTLVLDISEGGLKGQHVLALVEETSRSVLLWIVIGGLIVVVLVVAGMIGVRRRIKSRAEPGAAPDPARDGGAGSS
jgi:hypothetical protein